MPLRRHRLQSPPEELPDAPRPLDLPEHRLDDALSVAEGGEPRRTGPEDAARVREVAARLGGEALLLLLDRCLEADEQIDRDMGIALVLEALLDSMAQRMG